MNKFFGFIKKYSLYIFIVYIFVLFLVLVMKFPQMNMFYDIIKRWKTGTKPSFVDRTNLVPFKIIVQYVRNMQTITDWFGKNLMVNTIMFMPLGFLTPLFIKKNKIWQVLIYGIITSILVECLQIILVVGTGDIDDVILNSIGTLVGFGIYKLIYCVWLKE